MSAQLAGSPLSIIAPLPAACRLPADYDRHGPSVAQQRRALLALVGDIDWPQRSWRELIELLLRLGRTDIALSRLAEGHVDALRILAQAGAAPRPPATGAGPALYGVWASRSMRTGVSGRWCDDGRLRIDGTLRFASGAGLLDRALVPVWIDADHHLLVDLPTDGLPVDPSVWRTGAMAASRTYELRIAGAVAEPDQVVGAPDFYLDRPGFFPGGVGVAACWTGGAVRVVDLLRSRHATVTPAQQRRLGTIRADLVAATAAVRLAAARLDEILPTEPSDWQVLATEARLCAAAAIRRIIADARLLTGPAGVAMDDDLAHALPDLELYVLQQNADADAMLLGDPERIP
ncbi:hypothetical protein [Microlunatus ginsengisoli]|uniref:Acyl-CoA dehydrogenase family protein n=1 Tax=Microlunatus ginsengisoli TaxID=363863 RepID=A0ABP7AVS8_9ACTN